MKDNSLRKTSLIFLFVTLSLLCYPALADDGYNLWLKYPKVDNKERLKEYQQTISSIILTGNSTTCRIIQDELKIGLYGLLGKEIPFSNSDKVGSLIIGTPRTSNIIKELKLAELLDKLGKEGYLVKSTTIKGKKLLLIIANEDIGLLYRYISFITAHADSPIT